MYNSHDLAISIKKEAKNQGIVIKDMLSELNIGSNTMSALYHGKSIAYDSLARIADYLNVSLDCLLNRTNVPNIKKETSSTQAVFSFEGEGSLEQQFDKSKLESLAELHQAASFLSTGQIKLLATMAENMKDKD